MSSNRYQRETIRPVDVVVVRRRRNHQLVWYVPFRVVDCVTQFQFQDNNNNFVTDNRSPPMGSSCATAEESVCVACVVDPRVKSDPDASYPGEAHH